MRGGWHIVTTTDYAAGLADLGEAAYIVFDGKGGGALALGCVTGVLCGGADAEAVAFVWDGSDELDEIGGHGWVEMRPDGSLVGWISFDSGEEVDFVARPWDRFPEIH
jgi:hypothetical protein